MMKRINIAIIVIIIGTFFISSCKEDQISGPKRIDYITSNGEIITDFIYDDHGELNKITLTLGNFATFTQGRIHRLFNSEGNYVEYVYENNVVKVFYESDVNKKNPLEVITINEQGKTSHLINYSFSGTINSIYDYQYTDENMTLEAIYVKETDSTRFYKHSYDDKINPWYSTNWPGHRSTFSRNNRILDCIDYKYDEDGYLIEEGSLNYFYE